MNISKTFLLLGLLFLVIGLLWPLIEKSGLGRLPGDLHIQKDNFTFYFPITTSIILSVVITLILWLLRR